MRPASGGEFEIRAAAARGAGGRAGRSLGRWPRSGAEDVAAALSAAAPAAQAWSSASPLARVTVLDEAARELGHLVDPEGLALAALGLNTDEDHALSRGLRRALAEGTQAGRARAVRSAQVEPVALVRDWRELAVGLGRALFEHLARGRTVVLFSDPHLPMLADRFASVLSEAGLPPGVLAVLHDDGRTALRLALGSGRVSACDASGPARMREELDRLCAEAAPGAGVSAFGAGVIETPRAPLTFRELGPGTATLSEEEDAYEDAEDIAALAFGRTESLSGQRDGAVGRVLAHPRVFSQFTEDLLDCLEASEAFDDPLPLLVPETTAGLARARDLGLDEGATLIHEGFRGSPSSAAGASLVRLVFTNVEPQMRLWSLSGPLPLLLLARSPDGIHVAETSEGD